MPLVPGLSPNVRMSEPPPADLPEEVQVVVGNVDAESGRGSGQVSLQTRSGTNQIHGAAFYFNNNSALNSNSYFQNVTNQKKTYTNRNQYGGRLGGPIVKNKAFFFFNVENFYQPTELTRTRTVLTTNSQAGVFSYVTSTGVRSVNLLSLAAANGQLATVDPTIAQLLADMGADVIKVESPEGDGLRQWPPITGGYSENFASLNRNKRSVVLDLKLPADREAARKLALSADVLVENFRPGTLAKLGLGYEALATLRPALV